MTDAVDLNTHARRLFDAAMATPRPDPHPDAPEGALLPVRTWDEATDDEQLMFLSQARSDRVAELPPPPEGVVAG